MRAGALLLLLLLLAGCRFDTFRFYDVERTPAEECDILPQGEFCKPATEFSPPVTEGWSVEQVGGETRVYVDEEVWVANPPQDGADQNQIDADKLEVKTQDPGPCTTTTTRSISVLAAADKLTGKITEKTRLTGPADCGDTPRGLRTSDTLGCPPADPNNADVDGNGIPDDANGDGIRDTCVAGAP